MSRNASLAMMPAQIDKGSVRLPTPEVSSLQKAGRFGGGKSLPSEPPGAGALRRMGPMGRLGRGPVLDRGNLGTMFRPDGRIDEAIFTHEPQPNIVHPVKRRIAPFAPDVPPIAPGEIAILRRGDPGNLRVVRLEEGSMAQDNPLIEANPATWNAWATRDQLDHFRKDPEKYKQLDPAGYFWQNWRVDGVMGPQGGMALPKQSGTQQPTSAVITAKGQAGVYPYWPGAPPGSHVYMVIKKFPFQRKFQLNSKYNQPAYGSGLREMLVDRNLPAQLRPFQIGFYATPHATVLPPQVASYQDEDGYWRHDGLVIRMGTIAFAAQGREVYDPAFVGDPSQIQPHTNTNANLSPQEWTKTQLIVDFDDGIYPV